MPHKSWALLHEARGVPDGGARVHSSLHTQQALLGRRWVRERRRNRAGGGLCAVRSRGAVLGAAQGLRMVSRRKAVRLLASRRHLEPARLGRGRLGCGRTASQGGHAPPSQPLTPTSTQLCAWSLLLVHVVAGVDEPSWWECVRCDVCLLRDADAPPPPATAIGSRRHCAVCVGCTHHLEELPLNFTLADSFDPQMDIPIRFGSTGAALFLATDAGGKTEVLKLHGTPSRSVTGQKLIEQRRGERRFQPREIAMARVLTPLAVACGLGHVSTAEHVTRVRAVLPGSGEQLWEPHAVLAEHARGVSLDILTLKVTPDALLKRLAAVPHAAVRDAAIYDLLFRQGDRHAENVFIADGGSMKLIDSRDAALAEDSNSCFLPGSYYFERARVGVEHITNATKPPVSYHWPQLLLDYRCHVPGGAIGTNYPPKLRECLAEWSAMSAGELYEARFAQAAAGRDKSELQPLMRQAAARLHAQATAMVTLGFEGALHAVTVANSTRRVPFRSGFPKQPPCCALQAVPEREQLPGKPFICAPGGGAVTVPPQGDNKASSP